MNQDERQSGGINRSQAFGLEIGLQPGSVTERPCGLARAFLSELHSHIRRAFWVSADSHQASTCIMPAVKLSCSYYSRQMGITIFLKSEKTKYLLHEEKQVSSVCLSCEKFLTLHKTLQTLGEKCIDVDSEYFYLLTIKMLSAQFLFQQCVTSLL